jgi:hypothetical protein
MTRQAAVTIAGWCAATMAFVVACGGGGSGASETRSATAGASVTATIEAGSSATAAPSSATSGTGADAGVRDGPGRFFVDAAGGSDDGTGKRAAPFATITRALQAAAGSNATIYVAGGTYVEQLSLVAGVTVSGGYDPASWRQNASSVTSIEGTMRDDGATAVTVDSLQVRGSEDSAALIVKAGGDVDVRNSTLIARKGSTGAAGRRGRNGATGSDGTPGMDAHGCPPDREGG